MKRDKSFNVIKQSRKAEKHAEPEVQKPLELLLCSADSTDAWATNVVNPINGAGVWAHKGVDATKAAANQAILYKDAYLLLPMKIQPAIFVVGLHPRDKTCVRLPLPAPATCLAVHPRQQIVCAAIGERLYTWTMHNGHLQSVVNAHFQSITSMQFTQRGHFVVTTSADGSVKVWTFASLLTSTTTPEPYRTFNAHSMPIDCMTLGCALGGSDTQTMIVTGSRDRTVKLLSLSTHTCHLTVRLDVTPTSVVMDSMQSRVFIGGDEGRVMAVNLYANHMQTTFESERTHSMVTEDGLSGTLVNGGGGVLVSEAKHTITCMSLSADGQQLTTGDKEGVVRVWHVPTMQCVRKSVMKGPITTLAHIPALDFLLTPNAELPTGHASLWHSSSNKNIVLFPQLQRTLAQEGAEHGCARSGRLTLGKGDGAKGERETQKWIADLSASLMLITKSKSPLDTDVVTASPVKLVKGNADEVVVNGTDDVSKLSKELSELREANAKLVTMCEEEMIKNSACSTNQSGDSMMITDFDLAVPSVVLQDDAPAKLSKNAKKRLKNKQAPVEDVDQTHVTAMKRQRDVRKEHKRVRKISERALEEQLLELDAHPPQRPTFEQVVAKKPSMDLIVLEDDEAEEPLVQTMPAKKKRKKNKSKKNANKIEKKYDSDDEKNEISERIEMIEKVEKLKMSASLSGFQKAAMERYKPRGTKKFGKNHKLGVGGI